MISQSLILGDGICRSIFVCMDDVTCSRSSIYECSQAPVSSRFPPDPFQGSGIGYYIILVNPLSTLQAPIRAASKVTAGQIIYW